MHPLLWFVFSGCGGLTYYGDDLRRLEEAGVIGGSGGTATHTGSDPGGTVPSTVPEQVDELEIVSVTPNAGPLAGGTAVLVAGVFDAGTVLGFDGVEATITSRTATQLSAIVPAGAASGWVDVTVASGPRSAVLRNGYEYFAGPEVTGFVLDPFLDHVLVEFTVSEGDASLVGGTIEVSDGVTDWSFDIPDEIPGWSASGTNLVEVDPWDLLPCDGVDETWTLTVIDSAGRPSDAAATPLEVQGFGMLPELVDSAELSVTETRWVACVEFNDAASLADAEDMEFDPVTSASYGFYLGWEESMDCDIALRPASFPVLLLDASAAYGFVWEEFHYDLAAGTEYVLNTRLYDAPGVANPPFRATVLVRED